MARPAVPPRRTAVGDCCPAFRDLAGGAGRPFRRHADLLAAGEKLDATIEHLVSEILLDFLRIRATRNDPTWTTTADEQRPRSASRAIQDLYTNLYRG
ncbi:MAG: hypothetical protein F4186_01580 [Boseongicola sp. SB0676_bin_33]|uniref:Uncharacterized protein n=1 Tax=Boseongicola sp. SB0664_bin_43 TaxID=2604844 RepID=A0A6B0XYN7_9RHOB|nr:hypothetical protein [Boseongicola sp. SB0664_bin_43]MYF88179.1 hypothetical protein [Boseongicola sp. SB0676_bin_33]MYK30794.1 hypothetical protein [Boseongicola sp. SB0670_bin_30]